MIVDDSATMRKIIFRIVAMSGFKIKSVEEASSGRKALEKLKKKAADIILCDMNMPEMSGAELVKKIHQELPHCKNTKIIIISAEHCQDRIDDIMTNGADGYITKPFTPEKLHQKLSELMQVIT
jgi:two-component system chemotaxis response regulator CheY